MEVNLKVTWQNCNSYFQIRSGIFPLNMIESKETGAGKVTGESLEKELPRHKIELCNSDTATIFISGMTILTLKRCLFGFEPGF